MEGLNDIRTAIGSENIQLQSYIATYRKKLEEVVFVEEEFLYKMINVYVDYGAMADIPQVAVKQYMVIWQRWSRWNKLLLFSCKPTA